MSCCLKPSLHDLLFPGNGGNLVGKKKICVLLVQYQAISNILMSGFKEFVIL